MKTFIKLKLLESLNEHIQKPVDLSKIEISMDFVNGLLVFLPFYNNERMGSFRLKKIDDSAFKIESTNLYDRFQNQHVGSYMYKEIIKILKDEGYKLYSDDQQTDNAKHVWNSLVSNGLAVKNGNQYSSI